MDPYGLQLETKPGIYMVNLWLDDKVGLDCYLSLLQSCRVLPRWAQLDGTKMSNSSFNGSHEIMPCLLFGFSASQEYVAGKLLPTVLISCLYAPWFSSLVSHLG